MSTIYVAGTSAKLYAKLAKDQEYDLSVVGIGDTVEMLEKGSKVSLTAVQLNPDEIHEEEDGITSKALVSISVSCLPTSKHTLGTLELIRVHVHVAGVGGVGGHYID